LLSVPVSAAAAAAVGTELKYNVAHVVCSVSSMCDYCHFSLLFDVNKSLNTDHTNPTFRNFFITQLWSALKQGTLYVGLI